MLECADSFGHNSEMRKSHLLYLLGFALLICAFFPVVTPADSTPEKSNQYIYVLRLVPRLYDDKNWTPDDNAVLQRHLARFKHAIETGELILAGRTREAGDKTFGVAIFQAPDEESARQFMDSDPAVVAG